MAYTSSVMQLKLKRTPDLSEVWTAIDKMKSEGYKVSTSMNLSSITVNIFPYPRDEILAIIKHLSAKYRI